jgi:hypothetical protein
MNHLRQNLSAVRIARLTRNPLVVGLLWVAGAVACFVALRSWAIARGPGPGWVSYTVEKPLLPVYAFAATAGLMALGRFGISKPAVYPKADRRSFFIEGLLVLAAGLIGMGLALFWLALAGRNIEGLVRRSPNYWDRADEFVKQLPLGRSEDKHFSPYFYDATRQQLVNDCPVDDSGGPWSDRYCGEMLNLGSTRNFFEFQNLQDIAVTEMFEQASELVQRIIGDVNPEHESDTILLRPLKSLGIRYLAIDGRMPEASVVLSIERNAVSILDLGSVRPADLSVASLKYEPYYNRSDAISSRINGNAIIYDRNEAAPSPLKTVKDFELIYQHGSVAVHARSSGESVFLLPFQFSHCLSLEDNPSAGTKLLRVNGGQAALRFERQVDVVITNHFRYFGRTACRYDDFADAFYLHLWPALQYKDYTAGLYVPFLMKVYLEQRIRFRDQVLKEREPQSPQ